MKLLGDGGEDVSCILEDWHLDITDTESDGQFDEAYLDKFLDSLKTFFSLSVV